MFSDELPEKIEIRFYKHQPPRMSYLRNAEYPYSDTDDFEFMEIHDVWVCPKCGMIGFKKQKLTHRCRVRK
jgi:hypothetical protein